jgi:branched-chain amino acid transport system permease protein
MNSGATSQAWPRRTPVPAAPGSIGARRETDAARAAVPGWLAAIGRHVRPVHVVALAVLVAYPWVASPFFTYQIGAQSLALGLVAVSLTFLAGYGGMVSLAQMTVAGIAGYAVAIFGASGTPQVSLGWPWWLAVALAIPIAVLAGTLIGWLSVRTEGIYTIMITLAIGVAFYYLALQNYAVFNGFQGFQRVLVPSVAGVAWGQPIPFYYLALFWALAGYAAVVWVARSPFGIALQGIRDNPRRMASLGFRVTAHRVAAYALAGSLAAVGGVLMASSRRARSAPAPSSTCSSSRSWAACDIRSAPSWARWPSCSCRTSPSTCSIASASTSSSARCSCSSCSFHPMGCSAGGRA